MDHFSTFERAFLRLFTGLADDSNDRPAGPFTSEEVESYAHNVFELAALKAYASEDGARIAQSLNTYAATDNANDAHHALYAAEEHAQTWYAAHFTALRDDVHNAPSLDALADALRDLEELTGNLAEAVDLSALPTFGDEPRDTSGIFSYDAGRFLYLDGTITIENRPQ